MHQKRGGSYELILLFLNQNMLHVCLLKITNSVGPNKICCGYSKEQYSSFEPPQHMFRLDRKVSQFYMGQFAFMDHRLWLINKW